MYFEGQRFSNRIHQINSFILQNVKSIYRLRKIGLRVSNGKSVYAYTVSMIKDRSHTLEELVECFYIACKTLLQDGERLTTDKKCFTITSDTFETVYCIEAWGKTADKRVYIENGQVKIELLHRMSCEQAAYIFKRYMVDPLNLINTVDILNTYENPADKYAALAKLPHLLNATQTVGKDIK